MEEATGPLPGLERLPSVNYIMKMYLASFRLPAALPQKAAGSDIHK